MLFQEEEPPIAQVAQKIKLAIQEHKGIPKEKRHRSLFMPCIDFEKPWGYFNGARQRDPSIVGQVLSSIQNSHHYCLKYAAGLGTNNKEEFMVLWIFLKVAKGERDQNSPDTG